MNLSENGAENYNWAEEGVYQLEVTDPVQGGPGGIANRQATELARRTRNLHTRLTTAEAEKAPKESPTLTGTPTAPTPVTADNSTKIATTAFVKAVMAAVSITKAAIEAVLTGTITSHDHAGVYEPVFGKNTAFNKNFGSAAGTVCQGNDGRLSDQRIPTNDSVDYSKVSSNLKARASVTSSVNLSVAGIGARTLTANTAFSFSGFELNKSYLLIITANGYTPSWANGARHVPVEGNATFGNSGVFYVSLTCIDATLGAEKLLTMIMKGA